jgi:hypothetical protein
MMMYLERSREGISKGAVSYEMEKPQASNLSKAYTLHYRNIPVNWSEERSITICRTRHIVILHIYLTTRHNNMILHHNPDPTESPQYRSYGIGVVHLITLIVGNVKSWYGKMPKPLNNVRNFLVSLMWY